MTDTAVRATAVLCDMDGTLVDSTAAVVRAWTEFSAEHDLDIDAVLEFCHGRLTHATVDHFLPDVPQAERTRLADEILAGESDRHDGVVEVPGAAVFMARLAELGVPVALVTSAPRDLAHARMGVSGVEVPVVTVTSDDVTHGKPHPEPYLRGAELLGVPIEQCLVLEDADAGIVAGLTAGARVLVVGTHESPTTEGLPRAVDLTDVTVVRDGDEIVVEVAMTGLEGAVVRARGNDADGAAAPDAQAVPAAMQTGTWVSAPLSGATMQLPGPTHLAAEAAGGRPVIRLMNEYGTPWPLWDAEGPMAQSQPRLHPGLEARVRAWARDFATHFDPDGGWDDPARAQRHAATAVTLRDEIATALGPGTDVVLELWECPDAPAAG